MSWLLTLLSLIYGAGVRVRLWWYAHGGGRVRVLNRPVVSVGNLTVGGTGKTPLVIALGEALLARGVEVAVLSRGYGGALEGIGGLVSDGVHPPRVSWVESGDEPALIARRLPTAAVIVGRDRAAAWSRFGRGRRGICLLDDGFQHLALARDENVLLLDATESYAPMALLPRGRFREPFAAALARASAVVVTRVDQVAPSAVRAIDALIRTRRPDLPVFHARFELSALVEVGTGRTEPRDRLRGARVLAAAGIARFETFRRLIEAAGGSVVGVMPFRDHYPYRDSDVTTMWSRRRAVGAELILTTEKDAVKLAAWPVLDEPMWAARIDARVDEATEWNALIDRIAGLAAA